jgi:chitodextrinase
LISTRRFMLLVILFVMLLIPKVSLAATPHLLSGKQMNVGPAVNQTSFTTLSVTDGDPSTSVTLNSYTSAKYIWYKFSSPVTVNGWYADANMGRIVVYFYDSNLNLIYRAIDPVHSIGKDVSIAPVNNVSYAMIGISVSGIDTIIREFRVYDQLPDAIPPGNATALSVSDVTHESLRLNWNHPGDTDLDHVEIYIGTNFVGTAPYPDTSFLVTGLNADTNYWFTLYEVDKWGNRSGAAQVSAKTLKPPPPPPPPPSNVTIRADSVRYNSVSLSFTATDATEIKLYRDGNVIGTLSGTATTYTDNSVSAATDYQYWIVASNASGNTASGVITVTTPQPPPPPTGVTIQADVITHKSVTVSFTATGANEIKLYRDGIQIAIIPPYTNTYTDTSVKPNTKYQYWIVASNPFGSTASPILDVQTASLPPPSNVGISLAAVTKNTAELAFTTVDADNIKLYRDGKLIATLPGTATRYTDSGLQPGTSYQYWIVATNAAGNTASPIITATTKAPAQIKNLRATDRRTNQMTFIWDNEPTAEKYVITYTVTRNGQSTTFTTDTKAHTFTVPNLQPDDQVAFQVAVYNAAFGTHGAATLTVTVPRFNIPTYPTPGGGGIGTPNDVFQSAVSLASNFWPLLLLSLAFVLVPWLYSLMVKATKKPNPGTNINPAAMKKRELDRMIRLALRKEN